jgi:NAD(P)-dependent dehydrogenase (short-subunit alcohol dehydrogenase family)
MDRLKGKTVFITGGISGIGKACSLAAAREGANVAVADLKSDDTESVLNEIRKENPDAIFIECDVSDFEAVRGAVQKVIVTFGTLDVALNNAGISGEPNKVGEMSEEGWLKVIAVNLNGVFNCMRHELAHMAKQGSGSIINMASILGKVGFATSSHYVAAKHGVIGLTQTAALEYAAEGIRVNAMCPGFIETPLLEKGGINEDVKQAIISLHPVQRLGTSEELTGGFIFLASDESSFVTGTSLEIDGGYLAR